MKVVSLWGPVLVVMGLIFGVSAMSDPGAPPGGLSDKGAHVLAYAALGAALVRALARGRSAAMRPPSIACAALLASLYGVTDELHQHFVPGRTPELMDLVADGVGGLLGAASFAALSRASGASVRRRM